MGIEIKHFWAFHEKNAGQFSFSSKHNNQRIYRESAQFQDFGSDECVLGYDR